MQIDFALERQHVGAVSLRLRSRRGGVLLFHSTLQSSMDHHPSVWITLSTSERSSIKKSGSYSESRSRLHVPVATATVRAPRALPQAISRGVSPITSISDAENSRSCFSFARARANGPSRFRSRGSSAHAPGGNDTRLHP